MERPTGERALGSPITRRILESSAPEAKNGGGGEGSPTGLFRFQGRRKKTEKETRFFILFSLTYVHSPLALTLRGILAPGEFSPSLMHPWEALSRSKMCSYIVRGIIFSSYAHSAGTCAKNKSDRVSPKGTSEASAAFLLSVIRGPTTNVLEGKRGLKMPQDVRVILPKLKELLTESC